jgi:hypothetical protein
MTEYDDQQDRRDTAHELHDRALAKRDRMMDHAPADTAEPPLPDTTASRVDVPPTENITVIDRVKLGGTGTFRTVESVETVAILPRDLDDYPEARDRVEELARSYDSIEVDRLPPMGALHWLLRCHRGDSVYVCRVTADGRLLSVQR